MTAHTNAKCLCAVASEFSFCRSFRGKCISNLYCCCLDCVQYRPLHPRKCITFSYAYRARSEFASPAAVLISQQLCYVYEQPLYNSEGYIHVEVLRVHRIDLYTVIYRMMPHVPIRRSLIHRNIINTFSKSHDDDNTTATDGQVATNLSSCCAQHRIGQGRDSQIRKRNVCYA